MANYHISRTKNQTNRIEKAEKGLKKAEQLKEMKKKSILSLGGIVKGRRVGASKEREFTKKVVSKRIAQEGL